MKMLSFHRFINNNIFKIIKMSKFESSTFGKISGRHGTAVAMKSKSTGENYLRLYAVPSNPKTAKQEAQRAKFGMVNSQLSCMRKLFKITFGSKECIHEAVSLAFKTAIIGTYPDFSIDYTKLIMSMGGVNGTGQVTVSKTTGTTAKVDWDTTVGSESTANDVANLIFFNPTAKIALLSSDVIRSAGTDQVDLPTIWTGAEIHCWIFFRNPDTLLTSTSQYIGQLQL